MQNFYKHAHGHKHHFFKKMQIPYNLNDSLKTIPIKTQQNRERKKLILKLGLKSKEKVKQNEI